MDDQTRVAMLRTGYDDGTPDTKYILSDHLGSSNVILETSGAVYNREEYYPFGETSFGAFGKKRYRYVGKEKDEESGLYYYGARYFQPWSCRFISVDPAAIKYNFQSSYVYADNNPVCKMDYNGEGTQGDPPNKASTPPANGTKVETAEQIPEETLKKLPQGPIADGRAETIDGKTYVFSNGKWTPKINNIKPQSNELQSPVPANYELPKQPSTKEVLQKETQPITLPSVSTNTENQPKIRHSTGRNTPGGSWDYWGVGSVPYKGEAVGSTNFIGPGPDVDPYTLGFKPIDAVDKAAMEHDFAYFQAKTGGVTGAVLNEDVLAADIILVSTAQKVIDSYKVGGIDTVTGLPISERTYNLAKLVVDVFTPLISGKISRAVSKF
jgi:RHS repeat-associated protein